MPRNASASSLDSHDRPCEVAMESFVSTSRAKAYHRVGNIVAARGWGRFHLPAREAIDANDGHNIFFFIGQPNRRRKLVAGHVPRIGKLAPNT